MLDATVDAWLASAAIQLAENVQIITQQAPDAVRSQMTPKEVDRALVLRVAAIYSVSTHIKNMKVA